ncbi:MAG: hypothetical protein KDD58_10305 [Bdellovibrionales bacterium]|nr:hypothetical protein [Bdellovibrionales bacterium]
MTTEALSPQKGAQTLFRTGALGPGAKLWITPGGEATEWNKKLDWYLNFQITRASHHIPKTLNKDFLNKIKSYNMSFESFSPKSDLLMISCEERLPTKMLVIIPFKEDIILWVNEIHQLWLKLLKPSIRIFLPQNFPISDFSNIWPDRTSISDITLVPSQKTTQG